MSPSTVRSELAELERLGLLTHPHTSAGRVPTEAGYRIYVDELLQRPESRPDEFPLGLPAARAEVEEALQATTEMLSQVTRLLALVSAPPLEAATVRHVEVLLLQPDVVLVVVIASTGSVTDLRFAFPEPVDPGLVDLGGRVPRRARPRRPDRLARGQARVRRAGAARRASAGSCRRSAARSSRRPTRTGSCSSAGRRDCSTRCARRRSARTAA